MKGAAARRDADGDPKEIEQLPGRLEIENNGKTPTLQAIQVSWLARRFAIEPSLARAVASLAFSRGEARG